MTENARLEELRRLVRNAEADVESSSRAVAMWGRDLQLSKKILATRRQALKEMEDHAKEPTP